VLLVGILVGTYSSIAIAAPFLLLGNDVKKDTGRKGPPANQLQKVGA
jgi:preprotein translocase subunit SecF